MTSSLVGSEMCIRYSPQEGEIPGQTPPPEEANKELEEIPFYAPGDPNEHCLLYTSDAADDM
eukprot:925771-Prorocentrum_lima.AAC.1